MLWSVAAGATEEDLKVRSQVNGEMRENMSVTFVLCTSAPDLQDTTGSFLIFTKDLTYGTRYRRHINLGVRISWLGSIEQATPKLSTPHAQRSQMSRLLRSDENVQTTDAFYI